MRVRKLVRFKKIYNIFGNTVILTMAALPNQGKYHFSKSSFKICIIGITFFFYRAFKVGVIKTPKYFSALSTQVKEQFFPN